MEAWENTNWYPICLLHVSVFFRHWYAMTSHLVKEHLQQPKVCGWRDKGCSPQRNGINRARSARNNTFQMHLITLLTWFCHATHKWSHMLNPLSMGINPCWCNHCCAPLALRWAASICQPKTSNSALTYPNFFYSKHMFCDGLSFFQGP